MARAAVAEQFTLDRMRHVIARGDAAIGPLDAHERRLARGRLRLHVGAERVVALEVAHRQVVRVHVLAGARSACWRIR